MTKTHSLTEPSLNYYIAEVVIPVDHRYSFDDKYLIEVDGWKFTFWDYRNDNEIVVNYESQQFRNPNVLIEALRDHFKQINQALEQS